MLVRSDLNMNAGKIASQAGHAALDTYLKALELTPELAQEYKSELLPILLRQMDMEIQLFIGRKIHLIYCQR